MSILLERSVDKILAKEGRMKKATDDLRNEHEAIKLALRILDKMCIEIEKKGSADAEDTERMISFLKVFADKCHHGKEENHLFPALEAKGIPKEGGPIGVMLSEHTEGRDYIRKMGESITHEEKGTSVVSHQFIKHARGYIGLLSEHIEKENSVLFQMADERLSASDNEELLEAFEDLEEHVIGHGKHEELHTFLNAMEKKYLN